MAGHSVPQSGFGRVVNEIEESAIALILGMMTLITFVNVILRYGFNTGLIWGLEAVTFLFAWLVLFGVSYAVKVTAHLGVDAVTGLFPAGIRKVLALISAAVFIVYAFLLLPIISALRGDTRNYLVRIAEVQWALMICVP